VRTGRSELSWENGIIDILGSIRIFYTDDEDPCVPMAPPLGTDLVNLVVGDAGYGYGLAATTSF
jgi:hypothetical protein